MPVKSINYYLVAWLQDTAVRSAYDNYIADMLYITAQGKQVGDNNYWRDIKAEMLGEHKAVDNRTAKEIINDTLTKHGIEVL
jgi:hypothetical protein